MAAPKRNPAKRRSEKIQVLMTPDQYQAFTEIAQRHEDTLSSTVLRFALKGVERDGQTA